MAAIEKIYDEVFITLSEELGREPTKNELFAYVDLILNKPIEVIYE